MIVDLGLIDYEESFGIQKEFVRRRVFGEIDDSLILAEHKPVFTIGRMGNRNNLLVSEDALKRAGIKVLSIDRGGDITFHGPGQIVLYPIIDLKNRGMDLHRYIRDLEDAAINFLEEYSIVGRRISGKSGVWTHNGKIAAIGVAATNWITYHGMSINIDVDLRFFSMIYPCGLKNTEVASLNKILNKDVVFGEAKVKILYHFKNVFGLEEIELAKDFAVMD